MCVDKLHEAKVQQQFLMKLNHKSGEQKALDFPVLTLKLSGLSGFNPRHTYEWNI
jgi:hypothetical protein